MLAAPTDLAEWAAVSRVGWGCEGLQHREGERIEPLELLPPELACEPFGVGLDLGELGP
jgi:hypothetical protein